MGGYFTNGSNWLQLRPPVFNIRGTRSQPERFLWKKSEFYERQ
jgi:hypothetical protein